MEEDDYKYEEVDYEDYEDSDYEDSDYEDSDYEEKVPAKQERKRKARAADDYEHHVEDQRLRKHLVRAKIKFQRDYFSDIHKQRQDIAKKPQERDDQSKAECSSE